MRRHNLAPNPRLSQSFLADGTVLESIIAAAAVTPARRVLEVGPGPGILTAALLAAGAAVTAVEVDRRMVAHLAGRFGHLPLETFRLVEGDVLDLELADLIASPFDLVANLPYHVTSPILHQMLGGELRPERFVLMLQREVAERVAAAPGAMSYLSVFVQYHAEVRVLQVVPAAAFEPAPQVDSAIVVGTTRVRRLAPPDEDRLWRLVQAGFRERRKMLHNVLPRQLPQTGAARFGAAMEATGIAPDRRPQTLSVAEWLSLAAELGPLE